MHTKPFLAALAISALSLPHAPAQQIPPPAPNPTEQAAPPILNPIVINVLGEVNRPSRVVLPRGSGLLDAIAAAEGINRMANPAKTLLIHKTAGEKPDSVKIDLKLIMSGGARDIALRDGDTVIVGAGIY